MHVEVDRQVVRALRAATPGPCVLLPRVGRDAGLDRVETVDRAAVCFLAFASFNLADDLADGDCDYLEPAPAQAVVLILQTLFAEALGTLALPRRTPEAVHRDLLVAEEAQVLEVMTASWDAARLRVVTDGIAGRQWSAYLRIMWAGTPFEQRAEDVALRVSRAALLAGDISSHDRRWTTLPPAERRTVVAEALDGVAGCTGLDGELARFVDEECRPVLEQVAAEPTTGPPARDGTDPPRSAGRT